MKQIFTLSQFAIAIAMPLTLVGWAFSSASLAGDSLSLNQLLSSAQPSPQSQKLMTEISSIVHSSKTYAEQVRCTGTSFVKQYNSLSKARVAPFDCRFPNNLNLKVYAQTFVILPSGRVTPIENARNLNFMPQPVYFSYKITSWNWNKSH